MQNMVPNASYLHFTGLWSEAGLTFKIVLPNVQAPKGEIPPIFPKHRCRANTFEKITHSILVQCQEMVTAGIFKSVAILKSKKNYFEFKIELDLNKRNILRLLTIFAAAIPGFSEFKELKFYMPENDYNYLLQSAINTEGLIALNKYIDKTLATKNTLSIQRDFKMATDKYIELSKLKPNLKPMELWQHVEKQMQDVERVSQYITTANPAYGKLNMEMIHAMTEATICHSKHFAMSDPKFAAINEHLNRKTRSKIHEFIRRIPNEEWQLIAKELETITLSETVLKAIINFDTNHAIFQDAKQLRHHVLKAVFEDFLNPNQSAILLLYAQALTKYKSETIQVLTPFNKQYKRLLKHAFVVAQQENTTPPIAPCLNQAQLQQLLEVSKNLHDLHRTCLIIPLPDFQHRDDDTISIMEHFYFNRGFQHSIIKLGTNYQLLLIPPMMFHELLKIRFPETVIKPNPVLGFSDPSDFEYHNHRDVLIPFKGITIPNKADNITADGIGIYMHDLIYHCAIESSNPYRKIWLDLATLAKPHNKELWNVLLDRDIAIHHDSNLILQVAGKALSHPQRFLLYLVSHSDYIKGRIDKKAAKLFLNLICDYLSKNQNRLKKAFNIDVYDLKEIHKVVNDYAQSKVANSAEANDSRALEFLAQQIEKLYNRFPKITVTQFKMEMFPEREVRETQVEAPVKQASTLLSATSC